MTAADWMPWVSLGVSVGTPVAFFVGRNWLKARIEKGVQHHFDRQIEGVRAEFRQNEERLKSDLRDRESEISALRNAVLDGSASRQSMLDKRRFKAAERIWTAVTRIGPGSRPGQESTTIGPKSPAEVPWKKARVLE